MLRLYLSFRAALAQLPQPLPELDFETKLCAKGNFAEVLRAAPAKPGYAISPINIGSNTDPYQPIEKRWRLTRAALELLAKCRHPCTIVTKNALVERDLDILVPMAREQLVQVFVSVGSLDNHLAAKLEPRASAPARRIGGSRPSAPWPKRVCRSACWWRRSSRP